jgi:endonuclease YncB( thermonuclease family)
VSLRVVFFRRFFWTQTLLWLIYCANVAVLPLSTTAYAVDFTGPVVSVLDGDTREVLNGHHAELIRLNGIDCPEKGQAFGKRASKL